jgi:hypothetical protein
LLRWQLRFKVDGKPAQSRHPVGQIDAQHNGLHTLYWYGLPDHGLGCLHQGQDRAVWLCLEKLRARVIVGEASQVLLHPGQVLEHPALLGDADARCGWDRDVCKQRGGLDFQESRAGLGVEIGGKLPQFVPGQLVEREAISKSRMKQILIHDNV